jgi:hypothetical protein
MARIRAGVVMSRIQDFDSPVDKINRRTAISLATVVATQSGSKAGNTLL